jgi:two-component system, LytTR family, response regulator LytT
MSLRILIIEDELLGLERLRRHLHSIDPAIEIAGATDSVRSSVSWLRSNESPDLILMDIDLGDGQSFDIFQQVTINSWVIFIASYDEYALKAFRMNGIEYLLKPVRKNDLKESLEKFHANGSHREAKSNINIESLVRELQHQLLPKEFRQRFLVRHGKKLVCVENHEISYFFADGRSVYVRTTDKRRLLIDHSFEELRYMLNPQEYFYIHGSYIVSLDSIYNIHEYSKGRLQINLRPSEDKKVIIEKDQVQEFKAWLGK